LRPEGVILGTHYSRVDDGSFRMLQFWMFSVDSVVV
jgi:hypothetical protein